MACSWFYYNKFIMMHGHMDVRFVTLCSTRLCILPTQSICYDTYIIQLLFS